MSRSDTSTGSASGLSLRWQRAAMLGSLWAANEIVLGSFLHNVGVPFAGTALAGIGVMLLVAGHRLWHDPGVIWRAGVICSLMKSISPSAVILGPMAGILLESGLVYVCVVAFRGWFPGALLGGMLATVTPVLQKIVTLVVSYGMDAARMYTALFTLLSERIQFQRMDAREALLVLVALQAIPGALAAAMGIAIARGVRHATPGTVRDLAPEGRGGHLVAAASHRFSLTALCVHVLLVMTGLALLPLLPPLLSPVPVAAYLSAVLLRYPGLRPRFKRSRLWFEFGVVAVLAGVLLGVLAPGGKGTWWTGLQSGIVMTARATLVVTAFSAISVELRNPLVINWFLRRGLGNVSSALTVAFRALPVMIQSLNQQRSSIRHPLRALSQMLATMLAQLRKDAATPAQPIVHILTGKQGEGKTTLLCTVINRLQSRGVSVGGILAHVRYEGNDRIGYDIEDVSTGERTALCRTNHDAHAHAGGPFVFHREGLSLGTKALAGGGGKSASVVVVDEVGPLELQGEGWATAVRALLNSSAAVLVLVVRPALVRDVQQHWGFSAQHVWDASRAHAEELVSVLGNVPLFP